MAGVRAVYQKLLAAKEALPVVAENAIDQTKDDLVELNREQMMEGKNKFGQNLTPSYFNDPYFKSAESAKRYSAWKDKITPNPNRPSGTPNYFINGAYHRSIKATVQGGKIVVDSDFKGASNIESKATGIYGLSAAFKVRYIDILKPVFNNLFREKLK